jgi:hypothetical protein
MSLKKNYATHCAIVGWLYTIAFAGLALALSSVGMAGAGYSGFAGFGRTAA